MNTIEDHLREGLLRLAEPVDGSGIDPGSVVGRGNRRLERRRAGWLACGLAAAVAASLLAWPGIGSPVIHGLPAPATGASAGPSVAAEAIFSAEPHEPALAYSQFDVSVTRTGNDLSIEIVAGTDAEPAKVRRSFTGKAGRFWSASVTDDLVVALLPSFTKVVGSVSTEWDSATQRELVGLGLTAVAVVRDGSDKPYRGLVWEGTDNSIFVDDALLPRAEFSIGVGLLSVFRDEKLKIWGVVNDQTDLHQVMPMSTEPERALHMLTSDVGGDAFVNYAAVGLLPEGATDPVLTFGQGDAGWALEPIGDSGRSAFLVVAGSVPRQEYQQVVSSVAYTDASGKRVSYSPRTR